MDRPAPELTTTPRHAQRKELDPVDRRLTAGLLALLLGFVIAIATWAVIWPSYRDANAPPEALERGDWPTTEVILWSLLVLALWIALWIALCFGFFYWALSRKRVT